MTFVFMNMTCRMGNQFFQYWAAKWIATQLNRPLEMYIHEHFQIDKNIYPNMGEFTHSERYHIPYTDKSQGFYTHTNAIEASNYNIKEIVEYHKDKTMPILLHFHVEDYSIMKEHEVWIKHLFARSPEYPLNCNDSIVIHLRLGDCSNENINVHNDYTKFALMVSEIHKLPIIIVTEELNHYCTQSLYNTLLEAGNSVSIANNQLDEYQKDFDTIASAKVIVATNSTFSWWPSFLNEFNPNVYIALSQRQPQPQRNESLFKRASPYGWKLWDMDNNVWINYI